MSIPHSGVLILSEFKDKYNLDKDICVDCDMFTEKIFDTGRGIRIISRLNPNLINMNRFKQGRKDGPTHLQKGPFWEAGSLSLIGKVILKEDFSDADKKKLILYYDKYHNLLEKSIKDMKKKKGYALVFDCHSMNSVGLRGTPDEGSERADFVVGSLDGKSANLKLVDKFCKTLEESGLKVKKNNPYKGGAIPLMYGKPKENVHIIMLEVKRANYMNEHNYELNLRGLKKINSIVSKAIEATSEEAKKVL